MRVLVLVLVGALLYWILVPRNSPPYPRQTIVLVGNPMTVYSWDRSDRNLTVLTFPEDMTAEGTHGYGTYSFAAFWRLGEIDKKDGTVLAESVAEALGIPVSGYTDHLFSFANILPYMRGKIRTNISFPSFLQYVWIFSVTKPSRVNSYDFTQDPSLIADDVTIADGSHQFVLSPQRIDARLAHVFEDERIRREVVTTAVYNTTAMPSLGNRVARLLGNLGVSVVSVGNDSPQVGECTISGAPDRLKSESALVIRSVLGCTIVPPQASDQGDLTVRIGTSYAKRFVSN